MDEPRRDRPEPAAATARRPSERVARAGSLGPWASLSELGRGSNGIVYRARRPERPEEEVALKVLPDAIRAGHDAQLRFRQEADLARRLEHPSIVRVLDAGESGPHAWYAMELCPGETLFQRLRRGALAPREAAGLVATLARAIAHAHERRVIHRDLKPANVIMAPGGGPRITDFGLARDAARERAITRTGEALGTPLYMAPEQLTGRKDLDERVDVWALGVILFECLAGRRPFEAPDGLSLAQRILTQDAPALRAIAPLVPESLAATCARALAREREERPSATELATDLEAFLLGVPPPGQGAPAARRGVLLVAGGVALVAATAGIGIGLLAVRGSRTPAPAPVVESPPPPPPPALVVKDPTRERLEEVRRLYFRGQHREAIEAAQALVSEGSPAGDEASAEVLLLLAKALDEADAGQPGDPLPILERLGREGPEPWRSVAQGLAAFHAARSQDDLQRARELASAALAAREDFGAALKLLARIQFALARTRQGYDRERLEEADRTFERACAATPEDCHPPFHRCLVKFHLQDYQGKVEVLTRAIRCSEPHPHFRSLFWRGHTLHLLGRHDDALRDFERCRVERPEDMEAALWRPVCMSDTGQRSEALAEWRRLVQERPADADPLLGGRGATCETQPLLQGVMQACAGRPDPWSPSLPTAARAALDELARRSTALDPWEALEPILERAAREARGDPEAEATVAVERGWTLFRRGRPSQALQVARVIAGGAASQRARLEGRFLEATLLLWGDDVPSGLAALGRLRADDPDGPVGLSASAAWNAHQGRHVLGYVEALGAIRRDGESARPLVELAACLINLGQAEEAGKALADALARRPDEPRALALQGTFLASQGRGREAIEALGTAIRLGEPEPISRALALRARLGLSLGQADAALADAGRLLARRPRNVEAALLHAAALEHLGRGEEARAELRPLQERDPPELRGELERLGPEIRARLRPYLDTR